MHGGQLATAAVVGTGDNLTLEVRIGGHGGRLTASAAVGTGGGGLAGGLWVGAYSCCAPVKKIFDILDTTFAICPLFCARILL